ncbi:MAG: hypothetical protein ACREXY_11240 [Gammaproteobacteria bacterium]
MAKRERAREPSAGRAHLDQIRRVELKNKQEYIKLNRARNDSVGLWLNVCRFAAVATPVAFISSAAMVAAC